MSAFASTPAAAADLAGPRVEAHVGWERVRVPGPERDFKTKKADLLFGLGLGYDLALGKGVNAGLEVNLERSRAEADIEEGGTRLNTEFKRDADVSARVGAVVAPGVLLYGKVGYANARVRQTLTVTGTAGTTTSKDTRDLSGVRAGAGVEMSIGQGVYAKAEYRFSDYEKDVRRHQIVTGVGVRF
ncbi:porin family protein [Sphingomonas sediminicola]|uniref:Porin family protein n=1 Tax=Sphingomonas sediminicola TaxID=386874 RepID=A0ABX6T7D8_9SPHN|nr:porin family protein [Sphingomonas sediminicola]QNP45771.1 porin family protein [Sphingomonas sediminicola]